jgi:hypothetical protein
MSRTIKKQPKKDKPHALKPDGSNKPFFHKKKAFDYSDNEDDY